MRASQGREILNRINDTESRNVQGMVKQVQNLKFDENDDATKSTIRTFYDNITSQTFTENERLMLMSSLNQLSEFSNFILGRFLAEEEKDILTKYDEWVMMGRNPETKPNYKTLNGFIDYYNDVLGISKNKAYYCVNLYERYTIDDVLKLGVKKTLATTVVKDDVFRRDVIEKASDEDWSPEQIRTVSNAISRVEQMTDEKEKKKIVAAILSNPDAEEVEEKIEKVEAVFTVQRQADEEKQVEIFKKYKFDIRLSENDDKQILIIARNKKQRDYINKALLYYEKAIKNYIVKCGEGE